MSDEKNLLGAQCPPSFKFGHGDWKMNMRASFGAGEDMCEIWNVGGDLMLRLKEGKWAVCESKAINDAFAGALEGVRCAIIDGWPHGKPAMTVKEQDSEQDSEKYVWSNLALSYRDILNLLETAVAGRRFSPLELTKFETSRTITPEICDAVRKELGIAISLNIDAARKEQEEEDWGAEPKDGECSMQDLREELTDKGSYEEGPPSDEEAREIPAPEEGEPE